MSLVSGHVPESYACRWPIDHVLEGALLHHPESVQQCPVTEITPGSLERPCPPTGHQRPPDIWAVPPEPAIWTDPTDPRRRRATPQIPSRLPGHQLLHRFLRPVLNARPTTMAN